MLEQYTYNTKFSLYQTWRYTNNMRLIKLLWTSTKINFTTLMYMKSIKFRPSLVS